MKKYTLCNKKNVPFESSVMLNAVKHLIELIFLLFSKKKAIMGILSVIFRFAQNDITLRKYICFGIGLFWVQMAFSQLNNLQISQQLMTQYAAKEGKQYYKIKGNLPEISPFQTDDCATYILEVFPPKIDYQAINKNIFLRKIEIRFIKSLNDSLISQTESMCDTLSRKQLRNIRTKSPHPYKGENPLASARFIVPSATVLGSVAAIIALFYLRSM